MTIVLCYICVNIDVTGRLPLQDRAIIRALKSKHQSQSNDTAFHGGVFFACMVQAAQVPETR
jgi:hypothetical protein